MLVGSNPYEHQLKTYRNQFGKSELIQRKSLKKKNRKSAVAFFYFFLSKNN